MPFTGLCHWNCTLSWAALSYSYPNQSKDRKKDIFFIPFPLLLRYGCWFTESRQLDFWVAAAAAELFIQTLKAIIHTHTHTKVDGWLYLLTSSLVSSRLWLDHNDQGYYLSLCVRRCWCSCSCWKKKELRLESSHQSAAITGALLQEILCIRRDVSFLLLLLLLLHHSMDFSSFFLLLSVKERSSVSAVLCLLPKDYVSLLGPGHHLSRQNNKSNTRQSEWTHWTAEEECLAFWPIKCNVIKIKEASEKRKERIDLFYFPFLACVPPPLCVVRGRSRRRVIYWLCRRMTNADLFPVIICCSRRENLDVRRHFFYVLHSSSN